MVIADNSDQIEPGPAKSASAMADSHRMAVSSGSVPMVDDAPLLLFDGDCNLCHGAVQFVIKRDPRARVRFASLQSAAGHSALEQAGATGPLPDSLVLVHGGSVRFKSAAALAIARQLRGLWPLLTVFWLVPYPLRDLVYDWVARHRYRWFGKRDECWIPTPELRARFVDAGERG